MANARRAIARVLSVLAVLANYSPRTMQLGFRLIY